MKKSVHQSFLWACGVALQDCPNEALTNLMYLLHLLMGSPPLPSPLMVTLQSRVKRILFPPPIAPADLPLWCPLPGPNDSDLQNRKLQQIVPGSQPHKGRGRKILWQDTWGILAVRPFIKIQNWFNA